MPRYPREAASLAGTDSAELRLARAVLLEWRERQCAYYRYATYYERYWPPRVRPIQRLALAAR